MSRLRSFFVDKSESPVIMVPSFENGNEIVEKKTTQEMVDKAFKDISYDLEVIRDEFKCGSDLSMFTSELCHDDADRYRVRTMLHNLSDLVDSIREEIDEVADYIKDM